jgi:LysM repeat protein
MSFKRISFSIAIFSLFAFVANAQSKATLSREAYIRSYKDLAIKEMLRSGVPASITLAQGMLESDNGNSSLAKEANNHFGIKCHNDWKGPVIYHDDDRQGECFRKYSSVSESYQDHSDFLMSGSRYSALFELDMTDYKGWARGLKKAGYATSNTYAEMLIKIIEENDLHQYDLSGASEANIRRVRKTAENKATGAVSGREILTRNRVKYIIVKPEDNFRSLREELHLLPFEIYKYNNLARDQELKPGQVVYLQPKRNRAEVGNTVHIVKEGETMQDISQAYAVKPERLYRMNLMVPGIELKAGDTISLRKQIRGVKPKVEKTKKTDEEDDDEGDLRFEFDQ